MSIMSIVFNFFLLKYGGTTAVAAFSVIMYVDSFVGMFLFGMTDALQPAISYCYGAGLMDKVVCIVIFDRMGRYVFFILFYSFGASRAFAFNFIFWNIGISYWLVIFINTYHEIKRSVV